jgi:hypothetical protein
MSGDKAFLSKIKREKLFHHQQYINVNLALSVTAIHKFLHTTVCPDSLTPGYKYISFPFYIFLDELSIHRSILKVLKSPAVKKLSLSISKPMWRPYNL